jgi:hypothetical protein
MAIILGVITPKINQMIDKTVISQTIDSMNQLNTQIQDTLGSLGSQRDILLTIKKGTYNIDGLNNIISFVLQGTNALISQPGVSIRNIENGDLSILTKQISKNKYDLFLTLNYTYMNLTFNNKDENKILTAAPTAYKLLIINKGSLNDSLKQLDIQTIGS